MPPDHLIADRFDVVQTLDRVTGEQVLITPRGPSFRWVADLEREQLARQVMSLRLPGLVPILHVGPGIVHACPPPAATPPRLLPDETAVCVLEACEILAHMHALGICGGHGLDFGRGHLRLVERDSCWHIAWLVLADDRHRKPGAPAELPSAAADLQHIARLFAALLDTRMGTPAAALRQHGVADADVKALVRIHERDLGPAGDAVALARLFVPLTVDPSEWSARIDTWPVVRSLPPRRSPSFDDLLALAESMGEHHAGGDVSRDEYITFPVAAAYHKRAGQRFARRELAAALEDVDRALVHDDFPAYHTTRAVILDALGRLPEAHAAITTAFASGAFTDVPARTTPAPRYGGLGARPLVLPRREHARAHATRGAIALRQGELGAAELDLRRALELEPTAAHARTPGL